MHIHAILLNSIADVNRPCFMHSSNIESDRNLESRGLGTQPLRQGPPLLCNVYVMFSQCLDNITDVSPSGHLLTLLYQSYPISTCLVFIYQHLT